MNGKQKQFGVWGYVLGFGLVILLAIIPLATISDSEFAGADGIASDAVSEIAPEYNNEWFPNIWEPPGTETESLLFAIQATVGGLLIGYCFGFLRGRKSSNGMASAETDRAS